MASPAGGGRQRAVTRYSAEDQALNQIAREAEQRLAARRAARTEARDIRMRELEKQQREEEDKKDKAFEQVAEQAFTRANPRKNFTSGDQTDDMSVKELKKEVTDLEDKYKKAMMATATLDNEKQTYRYQVDLLKDQLEDMEEQLIELQRLHRDTSKELDAQKRDFKDLQVECSFLKEQVAQRDKLIEEYGLVFVSNDTVAGEEGAEPPQGGTTALVTPQAAEILKKGDGNLDERLKIFAEEKEKMEEEIQKLRNQLEEEREKNALSDKYASPKPASVANASENMELLDAQMEAQRQLQDCKFKLKKAEQDITTFEGNVLRLEMQAKRYKQASENSEKAEEELKQEKRKLQRELREAQNQIEELQTQNAHLTKRLEKIKSARNAILKP